MIINNRHEKVWQPFTDLQYTDIIVYKNEILKNDENTAIKNSEFCSSSFHVSMPELFSNLVLNNTITDMRRK